MAEELLARYARGERDFRETDIEHPDVVIFDGEMLDGIDFSESFLLGSFRGASLRGAVFRDSNLKTCDFSDANLADADFRGSALDGTTFKGARLHGTRFAGAGWGGYPMKDGELPDW